jgi:Outer membrane lipoprotein carrier protein LolA-like
MGLNARCCARLLMAVVALAAEITFAAEDGDTLENLMALLAQRRHGVADFTQTQYLAVLKQPQRSEGVLSYDAPDHLEQRTFKPHPQSAVLDHGQLTLTRGSRQRTVRLDEFPQLAPLIDSVRATLAGDRPALERRFEIRLTGDLAHWQLDLTPRDSGLALGVQHIRLTGERDQIFQVEMQQGGSDHSLMTIKPRE